MLDNIDLGNIKIGIETFTVAIDVCSQPLEYWNISQIEQQQ